MGKKTDSVTAEPNFELDALERYLRSLGLPYFTEAAAALAALRQQLADTRAEKVKAFEDEIERVEWEAERLRAELAQARAQERVDEVKETARVYLAQSNDDRIKAIDELDAARATIANLVAENERMRKQLHVMHSAKLVPGAGRPWEPSMTSDCVQGSPALAHPVSEPGEKAND